MPESEKLTGGNSNQVTRQGNTVIRQCGQWSSFVHKLLRFLTAHDFKESPVLLENTATTETLSYIEGDVGNYPLKPYMQADTIVVEAAQVLRKFHDLTRGFVLPVDAQFMLPLPDNSKHEVICHNDFAPYNCVYRDRHLIGIIDFDTAAPGQAIWDIAYAVYRFVPLASEKHCIDSGWQSPPDRGARLKLFCDAYGLEDRTRLIETVIQRIQALVQSMRASSSNLEHIPIYMEDIAYIQAHQGEFKSAIL